MAIPVGRGDGDVVNLLELSGGIACAVDLSGRIRAHNAAFVQWCGTPLAGRRARSFFGLVHSGDRRAARRRLRLVGEGDVTAADVENRFRRHDGEYTRIAWRLTSEPGGELVYCFGQEARRDGDGDGVEAVARRRLADEHLLDTIIVTNADGVLTFVSASCAHLLGYSAAELIGKPVARLIHPNDQALAGLVESGATGGDTHTVTMRLRRKDQTYAWVESRSRVVIDGHSGGVLETDAALRDISESKLAQEALEQQTLRDALTGLANRTLLADRLTQGLRRLKRSPGYIGLLMLDLDNFKVINDTLGHQVGDALLVASARRLERLARPDDTVARFGGDEFVMAVQGLASPVDLTAFADRVVAALRRPYRIGDDEIVVTVSIGIAVASRPDSVPADMLREADLAMYRAKDRGRDRHEVYGAALQQRAVERLETERLIRRALADRRLIVEYQPIVALQSGVTTEVEALLRIDDAERGMLSPEHFIEIARDTGLLSTMDHWLRAQAMRDLADWRANPSSPGVARISVNIAARELSRPDFSTRLAADLDAVGLAGSDLGIEVTEHVLLQTSHSALQSLAALRGLGVQVGLDDFGTGFSALSQLRAFPLDFIKIDRSFIEHVVTDGRSASIVRAMIDLAHALGLVVVAEGVEQEAQRALLESFGCDRFQGFLFSRSLSSADLMRLVAAASCSSSVSQTRTSPPTQSAIRSRSRHSGASWRRPKQHAP